MQKRTGVYVWDGRDGLLKEGPSSLQGADDVGQRTRVRGRRHRATLNDDRLGLVQGCSSADRRLLMAGSETK